MKNNKIIKLLLNHKKKALVLFFIFSVFLVLGILNILGNGSEKYQLFTVRYADAIALQGKVVPKEQQNYYLDVSLGKIEEIMVQNGQEIQKDAELFRYQNSEAENQLSTQSGQVRVAEIAYNQAVSNLNIAQSKVNNISNKIGINSGYEELQSELETEKTNLQQCKQAVETAAAQLESARELLTIEQNKVSTNIYAKMDGIVTINEKGKDSAEVPVVQISSKENQIKATVTEYDIDKLSIDQEVNLVAIGGNQSLQGHITSINLKASQTSGDNSVSSYEFYIDGEIGWRNDLSVTVQVPQNNLIIPDSSIVKDSKGNTYVYVYKDGKTKKTKIEFEENNGKRIILSGLNVNDKIIENPDKKIDDKKKIEVIESDSIN